MRMILPALLLATAPATGAPVLTDVHVLPVGDGITVVPHFAADGRAATIVHGWRDNGNAHGHDTYLVLLPLADPRRSGVVTFDGKDGLEDTASASPFDGERVLGTIRFARARLDGRPATVMIRADLAEGSGPLADHDPVDIRIYRLDHPGVQVGTAPDVFTLASHIRPPGRFCNADVALHVALGLPLPAGYAGGRGPSGCLD